MLDLIHNPFALSLSKGSAERSEVPSPPLSQEEASTSLSQNGKLKI